MKITKEEVGMLFQKEPNNAKLRSLLQEIFSDKENIEVFAETFFPHIMTNKPPEFHKEIYDILFRNGNDALAAPRGHAKSTIAGLIFLIFCIVNKIEKYIVYISQNHAKTVQFIDPIRDEFKTNKLLRFVYGDLTPRRTKDDEGRDREDCFDVNGIRIEAVSFEKNLRGFKYKNMRPTLIIGDDIESDDRVLNPELREKDKNKLNKVIIPALDIDGRFKMIGTILHNYSLLKNKIDLYKGKIFKACDQDLNNILWKDRFTKEKLQKIREDISSIAFQQEYLNDPIDNSSSLIKREWIENCFREDLSHTDVLEMNFELKTMGVDFAFSDRITADESAFCGLGVKDGFCYLLHSQKERGLSVDEQMRILKNEIQVKYNFDKIGLEENSIKAISKDINQWKLPITLFWTSASDPAEKKKETFYENKRYTVGKINLIMRLGTAFENKRFIIPYKTEQDKAIAHEILSECVSYALQDGKLVESGIHPDIPIGLGYALELVSDLTGSAFTFASQEGSTEEIRTEIRDGEQIRMIGDRRIVE